MKFFLGSVLMLINCLEKCKYQIDGLCNYNETFYSQSPTKTCLYFSACQTADDSINNRNG